MACDQPLFSYGTLQLGRVQKDTFGRLLEGRTCTLIGWRKDMVKITDPDVLGTSGETYHPILRYTGNKDDAVTGSVFMITDAELTAADSYEVEDYVRIKAALSDDDWAWVYVAKDDVPTA